MEWGKFLENVVLHFLLDMISMIVEKMKPNVVEKNQFNFLQRLASGGWQTPLFYNLRCFLSPMQNVEKQKTFTESDQPENDLPWAAGYHNEPTFSPILLVLRIVPGRVDL